MVTGASSAVIDGVAIAVAVAFALLAGVFAWLWWKNRTIVKTRSDAKLRSENQRIDAELRLAEMRDRMRLIGDLHDAATVSMSQVISQAEGAKFSAETHPEVASRAAGQIADTARAVLNDLRRVVNVSREGVEHAPDGPSVTSLESLFQTMDESGLVIRFEESGEPFPVGSSAEIGIFRIVQEALNNTRQHGGPGATVKVSMAWSNNGLQLRVEDDGARVKNSLREQMGEAGGYTIADDQKALTEILSGRGMKDMKTRAEAFGGVFSAHRVPGVGFSVSASFPTLRFHNGVHGFGQAEGASS
jgi:signal transduction histidine kinase